MIEAIELLEKEIKRIEGLIPMLTEKANDISWTNYRRADFARRAAYRTGEAHDLQKILDLLELEYNSTSR